MTDMSVVNKISEELGIPVELLLAYKAVMSLNIMDFGVLLIKMGMEHEAAVKTWIKNDPRPASDLDRQIQEHVKYVSADLQRLGRVIMAKQEVFQAHPDYAARAKHFQEAV